MTARIMTTLIGGDLAIKTITGTSQTIYEIFGYINRMKGMKSKQVIKKMDALDLESCLRIVESLLKEIDKTNMTNTLILCLSSLNEMINYIHYEIKTINKKISDNKKIYILKYFRGQDFTENLNNLENYKLLLNERLNRLMKLLPLANTNLLKPHIDNENQQIVGQFTDIELDYSVILY
jgi:hypothetical protein